MSSTRQNWIVTRRELRDESGAYARVELRGGTWVWDLFDTDSMQIATGSADCARHAEDAVCAALDAKAKP